MVSLYLYLNLFSLSNTPFLLEGDQTFFWTYAMRMLQEERVYRDFFQFTPPGTGHYACIQVFSNENEIWQRR